MNDEIIELELEANEDILLTREECAKKLSITPRYFLDVAKFLKIKADGQKNGPIGRPTQLFSWNKVNCQFTLFRDLQLASKMSQESQLKFATGHVIVEEVKKGSPEAIEHLNMLIPGLGDIIVGQCKELGLLASERETHRRKRIEAEIERDKAVIMSKRAIRAMKKDIRASYSEEDMVTAIAKYNMEAAKIQLGQEDEDE